MRFLILALLLCSCGQPPFPHGRYQGEMASGGFQHDCTVEITPTAPDRVHIHLDYGNGMCDGDGALVLGDVLIPDAGGEITFDGYSLYGSLYSATGNEYRIIASPEGAEYVSPGRSPGYGDTHPIPSPEGAK